MLHDDPLVVSSLTIAIVCSYEISVEKTDSLHYEEVENSTSMTVEEKKLDGLYQVPHVGRSPGHDSERLLEGQFRTAWN